MGSLRLGLDSRARGVLIAGRFRVKFHVETYRPRRRYLVFHGGLSTQRTLPYGTVEDVLTESRRLMAAGAAGGYIFSPAHAVEGDVPVENMLAFIDLLQAQPGFRDMLE